MLLLFSAALANLLTASVACQDTGSSGSVLGPRVGQLNKATRPFIYLRHFMLCQRNFEHFLDGLFQIHHKSLSLTVTYSELSFFPKNLDVSEAKKAQLQRSIGFLARCPTCSEQPLFVKGNSRTNQQLGCSKPVGPSLSWVLPLFHLSLTYTFDTPLLKMQDLATIGRTHGPYL